MERDLPADILDMSQSVVIPRVARADSLRRARLAHPLLQRYALTHALRSSNRTITPLSLRLASILDSFTVRAVLSQSFT